MGSIVPPRNHIPPKNNESPRKGLLLADAAGFCHTDAVFARGLMSRDLPSVSSHEFASTAVALGPSVDPNSPVKVGTRVGSFGRAYRPCGSCRECRNNGDEEEGYSAYCPRAKNLD
ncbi:hypothetical protein OEA41_006588 [Lepraria neglecta]|uniref:Alcohol dehydrogenase-like N-terminal domain-containing protein n=1 Tax=Lepraria neglecta TaxID=209136 RepID=A0AAE0DKM1_9LECA|nr:hypothetical protein OEA41_006588 [Lepraria neglecta]